MMWCKLANRNSRTDRTPVFLLALLLLCGLAMPAFAQLAFDDGQEPPGLQDLQEIKKPTAFGEKPKNNKDNLGDAVEEEKDLAVKIRRDAMRDAAQSYGARGGLAFRTKQIMDELKKTSGAMDKAFDFRRLLIKAPSNLFIEPPIISEALNNFIVTPNGVEAAVADIVYQITNQARIVSAPRNWRQYLERDWKKVSDPPEILLPETPKERAAWRKWVAEGWEQGVKQADEIFQADLDLLTADFEGMIRYRRLLTENKISAPFATMTDRGISSTSVQTVIGNRPVNITSQMRVGDRALRITSPSSFRAGREGQDWETAVEGVQ